MYASNTFTKPNRSSSQSMAIIKLALISIALLFSGCSGMAERQQQNPYALYNFLRGVQGVQDQAQQRHYNYQRQQQEMYIRARQTALPMRQVAPTNTNSSQQYPMAPVNPAYSNNPSQTFINQGFSSSGGFD